MWISKKKLNQLIRAEVDRFLRESSTNANTSTFLCTHSYEVVSCLGYDPEYFPKSYSLATSKALLKKYRCFHCGAIKEVWEKVNLDSIKDQEAITSLTKKCK